MVFDPKRFLPPANVAEELPASEVMRHAYSMSRTEMITPDGIMRITAPSHLADHMHGNTGFEFSSDELSNPDYDFGGGKGLVIWLKRGFWNPNDGSYEKYLPTLQQETNAFVKHLSEKYDVPLACFMFSSKELEDSGTPCALIITGGLAAQEKLHGQITDDMAAICRKYRNITGREPGGKS